MRTAGRSPSSSRQRQQYSRPDGVHVDEVEVARDAWTNDNAVWESASPLRPPEDGQRDHTDAVDDTGSRERTPAERIR